MRVFLIGGTRFTGPALIEQLIAGGHDVMCVHRGKTSVPLPSSVREIMADRNDLSALGSALDEFRPDVVVDMFAFSAADAEAGVELLRGRIELL
jgi:nucleoside-diphosphate-sugar epimerase